MKIPAKTPEEHKYTSTGIKFWRHPEQMNNYKEGNPNTVISTHISPEGACNLTCAYCSVTYRDTHSRIEMDVIKDYVTKLQFFDRILLGYERQVYNLCTFEDQNADED